MIPKKIKYCRNCLLPSNTPNTTLNNKGICNLCADFKFKNFKTISKIKNNSRFELEKLLRNYPKNSGYDCIVALSGGKDSSYLTWLLVKKYGLKTLTITVDNGFMSPLALKNIELLTRKLNVDHKFIRAQALFNLVYRYAFKHDFFSTHQGRACNICCSLVPNLVFKYAIRKNIPIVFNGKFNPENPKLFRDINAETDFSKKIHPLLYNKIKNDDLLYIKEMKEFQNIKLPLILHPLNTINYREMDIINILCKELNIKNKTRFSPVDTNCFITIITMYLYQKKLGYNPYFNDVSNLIRWGLFNKKRWYKLLGLNGINKINKNNKLKNKIFSSLKFLGVV